jgi:hypothetical protein
MADECFRHPRLAAVYDALDPERGDLDAYLRMAEQFGARPCWTSKVYSTSSKAYLPIVPKGFQQG